MIKEKQRAEMQQRNKTKEEVKLPQISPN